MTVKDLMKLLEVADENSEVVISYPDLGTGGYRTTAGIDAKVYSPAAADGTGLVFTTD